MLKMNPLLVLMMALPLSVQAEVFKCKSATGKIIYQPEPCAKGAALQRVIKVKKMTPQEAEEAKLKLNAWQEQQATNDAAKAEADKQRQIELEREESLELQRRSVKAQEQEATAAQQPPVQRGGGVYIPPYGYGGRYGNYPYDYPNRNNQYYPHQYNDPNQPNNPPQQAPVLPPTTHPIKIQPVQDKNSDGIFKPLNKH